MSIRFEAVHPVLMARDVAESVRFFACLGFEPIFQDDARNPRYAGVRRGSVEVHLQWADAGQWADARDRPAYRVLVSDVDALHSEFVARPELGPGAFGGPYGAPADTPWGTREFHLRDPGGNVIQFYQSIDRARA